MKRIVTLVPVAIGLSVALAACGPAPTAAPGGGADPGGSPATDGGQVATTTDPCQLMTQAEAEALTGQSYGPGESKLAPGSTTDTECNYIGPTGTGNVLQLGLLHGDGAMVKSLYESGLASMNAQTSNTPVSGLGDSANVYTMQAGGGAVNDAAIIVLVGTWGVEILDTAGTTTPPTQDALVSAARTAIGRLPSA